MRLASLVVVAALVPLSAAQAQESGEFFSEFTFKELQFQFWPAGVPSKAKSDGQGSAITVHVTRVQVEGMNAIELRHCIDGDAGYCPYNVPMVGDNNGIVTAAEVNDFETLVKIGLRNAVPRVDKLATTLQKNVSVDGLAGKTVSITKVDFVGAEGNVDGSGTILADIEAKVTYDNDPSKKGHTIVVGRLGLKGEGFTYDNAVWKSADESWRFDAPATKPASARTLVNAFGFFSPQSQFENLSTQGIEFTIAQAPAPKKSPAAAAPLLIVGLASLCLLLRRNYA